MSGAAGALAARATLIAVTLLCLGAPGGAAAATSYPAPPSHPGVGASPLGLPPAPAPAQPVAPPTSTASTTSTASASQGGGLSSTMEVLIFAAGAAVLGSIAVVIVRDARRAAPVGERESREGPRPARQAERQRSRARAKAARRQRKRNR